MIYDKQNSFLLFAWLTDTFDIFRTHYKLLLPQRWWAVLDKHRRKNHELFIYSFLNIRH